MTTANLLVLAQADGGGGGGAIGAIFALLPLVIFVLIIVGVWKMFTKAGKPGWASIIPIYNMIVLCEIVGRPLWWVILLFIPLVNFVVLIILMVDLAKSFGKGVGYAIGLILLQPIFMPMLGLGSATYQGPAAAGAPAPAAA